MLFFIFYCLQISILFQMKKMDPFLLFCVFILFFFFTNFSLLYLWLFFALFIWCYLFSWRFCVLELGLRLSTIWLADFFDFSIDLSLSRLSCCICLLNASKKCFVRVFDLFIWYSNSWLFLLGWCWLCRWTSILSKKRRHFEHTTCSFCYTLDTFLRKFTWRVKKPCCSFAASDNSWCFFD